MSLIPVARMSAMERELLQVTRRGRRVAILPLWDDSKLEVPTCLAWSELPDVQFFPITEFAGGTVDDLEPLVLPPIVHGTRYPQPVRRCEVLVLAARFELDVRFGYLSARGNESVKVVRALSGRERLFYGAKAELLEDVPRGAQVPNAALRSYRFDRIQWAELPVAQNRLVRWEPGLGYVTEET